MKANNTTIENALHLAFTPEYVDTFGLTEIAEVWNSNHDTRDFDLNLNAYAEKCTYKMEQDGLTLEFDAWDRLTAEIERFAGVWVLLYCNEVSWSNRPEWLTNSVRNALNTHNTTPETPNTINTETKTMNTEKATAIYNRVESMAMRGTWNNGVKAYALMLLNWYTDEASENPLTLETMLNGANDWHHYSRSGCGVSLIYNTAIAETLCSPSELKRVKGGLRNPNSVEDWQDVEGRALCQAWQLIKEAETLVNCNA